LKFRERAYHYITEAKKIKIWRKLSNKGIYFSLVMDVAVPVIIEYKWFCVVIVLYFG
jgi:uncharacterized membrane protein